jgi:hypothetical protein
LGAPSIVKFTEFERAALLLADASERTETDAPTPEQSCLAAAVLRLAQHAPMAGLRIHAREMTSGDWQAMVDAYGAVSDLAEAQLRTVEGSVVPDIPCLSELALAQGVSGGLHVLITPGRGHLVDLLDQAARRALCGAVAVPSRAFNGVVTAETPRLCDECRERIRDIHQRIRQELAGDG